MPLPRVVDELCAELARAFVPIRVYSFDGNPDMVAGVRRAVAVLAEELLDDAKRPTLGGVADVPRALTQRTLESTIALTARELPRFGIPSPRVAVAGLNPDVLELSLSMFAAGTTAASLLNTRAQQVGTSTVITIDANDTITLNNVDLATLKLNLADIHLV